MSNCIISQPESRANFIVWLNRTWNISLLVLNLISLKEFHKTIWHCFYPLRPRAALSNNFEEYSSKIKRMVYFSTAMHRSEMLTLIQETFLSAVFCVLTCANWTAVQAKARFRWNWCFGVRPYLSHHWDMKLVLLSCSLIYSPFPASKRTWHSTSTLLVIYMYIYKYVAQDGNLMVSASNITSSDLCICKTIIVLAPGLIQSTFVILCNLQCTGRPLYIITDRLLFLRIHH